MKNAIDLIARASRFNEDAYLIAAGDPTLVHDLVAEVARLREEKPVIASCYGPGRHEGP